MHAAANRFAKNDQPTRRRFVGSATAAAAMGLRVVTSLRPDMLLPIGRPRL
jgi:hypothetical protein